MEEKGESSQEGDSSCTLCDLGKHQSTPGVCTACPAGRYQDGKGEKSCKQCDVDTYLAAEGKSSNADCIPCADSRSTGSTIGNINTASCLCKRGHGEKKGNYQSDDGSQCITCPEGGDCSASDGLTLHNITAKIGYWKHKADTSTFANCKSFSSKEDAEKRCIGGKISNVTDFNPDNQCLFGYGGPSCMACIDDYVTINGECVSCLGGGLFFSALVPMLSSCALLFLIVLVFILRGASSKSTDTDSARLKRLKRMSKLFGQMKILLSLVQIIASMPSVITGVDFSPFFREMSNIFSILNFDVLSFSGMMSCSMSVRFFAKFLIHMMLPIGCSVAILAAWAIARVCTSKQNITKRTQINEAVIKVFILIILLLFPGLSTKIFQVWKCTSVAGMEGQYLVQDYNIMCNQGEHVTFVVIAIGFLLLYIVGIPLTMFVLMFRNRKILHDESSPKHHAIKNALGGLYGQCKLIY